MQEVGRKNMLVNSKSVWCSITQLIPANEISHFQRQEIICLLHFSPHKVYLAQRWNHLNLKFLKLVSCEIWPVRSRLYHFFLKELYERLPSHTVTYSSVRHWWNSFRNLVKLELFHTNVRIVCPSRQKVSCDWDWDGVRPITHAGQQAPRLPVREHSTSLQSLRLPSPSFFRAL